MYSPERRKFFKQVLGLGVATLIIPSISKERSPLPKIHTEEQIDLARNLLEGYRPEFVQALRKWTKINDIPLDFRYSGLVKALSIIDNP